MADAEGATKFFAALTGTRSDSGASLRLGVCELFLVAPEQEDVARHRLDTAGPGPLVVGLATDAPGDAGELDRRLSHGVGIVVLRRN